MTYRTITCPHCQEPFYLLTNEEVAAQLGLDRSRVQQIARSRGLGQKVGPNGWRLFTLADVNAMRVKGKAGRPAQSSGNGTNT